MKKKRFSEEQITYALMRDTTELLQQSAMKSKVRSQHFWNAEGDVSMRHGREDRLRQQRAEHLLQFILRPHATEMTFPPLLNWRDAKFLAKKICVDGDLRLNLRRETINVFQDHRHALVLSQLLACADQEVPIKNRDRTC